VRETVEPVKSKPGRCAHHPGVAAVGRCEVCGRSLCVACAVPVRGTMIGPECLATVLERVPPPVRAPAPVSRGDWLAGVGFGLVLAFTLLPWSKVGEGSRVFGGWASNWSLLAAAAGLGGLVFALLLRYRPLDPRIVAAAYAVLAALVVAGAMLHIWRPPLLSEASAAPLLAVAGATLSLTGAAVKGRALGAAPRLHS
jgi:hypothetical protein